MRKRIYPFFILSVLLLLSSCGDRGLLMPTQNTFKIEKSDSAANILLKAAHTVPTKQQLDALKNEFIGFIHFGPNTFTQKEWGTGMENPSVFDLKELDTDQWCQTMKEAGMKMVLFTAKHHDGFVLWQSRYTKHGIMSTNFKEGKGDVLRELANSCKKYDLKLGIYLSPADLYQIENEKGLYGNLSEKTKRTIPEAVEGRPFENKTTFEYTVDDYNAYFLNQLFEVLTEYGPIHEVWFDGAHPKKKGGQTYDYKAWKELIHTLAPEAVIFGREDVRWCGNEAGATRATEWNVIPYTQNPDTATVFQDMTAPDLGSKAKLISPDTKYIHYQQAETNTSIREGWFYRNEMGQKVRSADDVFDIYERSVGGNSTFLLNIPPNRAGKFSPKEVEVLKEVGKRIHVTYDTNLLKRAKGSAALLDENLATYELLKPQDQLILSTRKPITINRIVLQEAIAKYSERVERHAVDAWIDGEWLELAKATNIGYKRILRFPTVTTTKVRVRILESRLDPAIATVSAHYYEPQLPELKIAQDNEGVVTIEPQKQEFYWKPHNQTSDKDLHGDFNIYYTVDGPDPTKNSECYTKPFKADGGVVKAKAIAKEREGALIQEQLGFIKKEWNLLSANSEKLKAPAKAAFDGDDSTFWTCTLKNGMGYIAIDLGEVKDLKGFAYTPSRYYTKKMLAKGALQISTDGKHGWSTVQDFYFGNLINDPTKRYDYLNEPVKSRFVRVLIKEASDLGETIYVGELDLF